jgi:hypothetical protein
MRQDAMSKPSEVMKRKVSRLQLKDSLIKAMQLFNNPHAKMNTNDCVALNALLMHKEMITMLEVYNSGLITESELKSELLKQLCTYSRVGDAT